MMETHHSIALGTCFQMHETRVKNVFSCLVGSSNGYSETHINVGLTKQRDRYNTKKPLFSVKPLSSEGIMKQTSQTLRMFSVKPPA